MMFYIRFSRKSLIIHEYPLFYSSWIDHFLPEMCTEFEDFLQKWQSRCFWFFLMGTQEPPLFPCVQVGKCKSMN